MNFDKLFEEVKSRNPLFFGKEVSRNRDLLYKKTDGIDLLKVVPNETTPNIDVLITENGLLMSGNDRDLLKFLEEQGGITAESLTVDFCG